MSHGGRRSSLALALSPSMRRGGLLHPLQPRLRQLGQLVKAVFGEVGRLPLQVRPHALDGVELGSIRRQLVDGQPQSGGDQLVPGAADVRIQIVLDQDDRATELLGAASSRRA